MVFDCFALFVKLINAFLNSLNKQSLDQAIKEYSVKLKADGIDVYLSTAKNSGNRTKIIYNV